MTPTRALLIDDHALVRAGIRALLNRIEGVEVVAEAASGRAALRLVESLQPDVVLLDLALPDLDGFEVLQQCRKLLPNVRIIVLTAHESGEYALQALRAGASGYLLKSAASFELRDAIETVKRGETYVSGEVARKTMLQRVKAIDEVELLNGLTPRQREVLVLIAEGNSSREIARILNIGLKTVETHRAQLMDRLNIREVAGLVRFAIRIGLVKVE